MCTEEFECLDLEDFGGVAFAVDKVIAIAKLTQLQMKGLLMYSV